MNVNVKQYPSTMKTSKINITSWHQYSSVTYLFKPSYHNHISLMVVYREKNASLTHGRIRECKAS